MNNNTRKPLVAMIALSAALAMPLAFAQNDTTDSQAAQAAMQDTQVEAAQDAAAQAETTSTEGTMQSDTDVATDTGVQSNTGVHSDTSATGGTTQSTPQTSASGGAQQGWEQVDTDMDGAISKQEAAVNPSLMQIFDQADGNADGSLTTEEYKTFVDKNYGEPKTK